MEHVDEPRLESDLAYRFEYVARFAGFVGFGEEDVSAIHAAAVQMNALLGFVSDAILATILGLDLDDDTRTRTLRAFNKLLWVQNDLVVRHYAPRA